MFWCWRLNSLILLSFQVRIVHTDDGEAMYLLVNNGHVVEQFVGALGIEDNRAAPSTAGQEQEVYIAEYGDDGYQVSDSETRILDFMVLLY